MGPPTEIVVDEGGWLGCDYYESKERYTSTGGALQSRNEPVPYTCLRSATTTLVTVGHRLGNGLQDERTARECAANAGDSIRFSIISAVYNVARYLPDFIAAIESQEFDLARVQVVVVDDGSTDNSLDLLQRWAARAGDLVTVLSKENGGQSSARNMGVGVALGEWLTFLDPDDMVDPNYLSIVDGFIEKNPSVTMVVTNRIYLDENTGEFLDGHPLRRMFRPGDHLVDLNRFPEYFHNSAPSSFMRARVVRSARLRFDNRIRPIFEDGHFCVRYLLAAQQPLLVGFLKSARYIYRRRGDGTSALQNSLRNPGRFVNVPRFGYLDILQKGSQGSGYPPEWIQQLVLYELSWYFSADVAISGAATAAKGDVARTFIGTLRQISSLLDPQVVESFQVRRFDRVWREVLLHLNEHTWHTPFVVLNKLDPVHKLVRVTYRYGGARPKETFLFRGRAVTPAYSKTQVHEFFNNVLMEERIVWLPANGTLRVMLDDVHVDLRRHWPSLAKTSLRPLEIANWFGRGHRVEKPPRREMVEAASTRRLAASPPVRMAFRDAWVLMDRINDAGDNGERLFMYLRRHRRDINAWFVVERDTPDWRRLKELGYKRIIAHDSLVWRLLMLNCRHLISSHVDAPVRRPPAMKALGKTDWYFTFLQHGVTKNDLSRWLNGKDIDLLVTNTPAEHASIVEDGSPYVYTDKEVKRTGMPRFDRLRSLGESFPPRKRNLVLVCPTWRVWLSTIEAGSHVRRVAADFLQSQYAREWLGLLRSDELAALVRERNMTLGFLPHPNVQPILGSLDLPEWVQPLTYADNDVQELIARCALMITDYSSVAFDAAYLDRSVVYFQFDAERVFAGGHMGIPSYYDYTEHGFGPVATTQDEVLDAVRRAAAASRHLEPSSDYQARIDEAFPDRDGHACDRVTKAIEALTQAK